MSGLYSFKQQAKIDAAKSYSEAWGELKAAYQTTDLSIAKIKETTNNLNEKAKGYFQALGMPEAVINLLDPSYVLLASKNGFESKAQEILSAMEKELKEKEIDPSSKPGEIAKLTANIEKMRGGMDQIHELQAVNNRIANIEWAAPGGFVTNTAIPYACCIGGSFVGAVSQGLILGGEHAFTGFLIAKYCPAATIIGAFPAGIAGFVFGSVKGAYNGIQDGSQAGMKLGTETGKQLTKEYIQHQATLASNDINKAIKSVALTEFDFKIYLVIEKLRTEHRVDDKDLEDKLRSYFHKKPSDFEAFVNRLEQKGTEVDLKFLSNKPDSRLNI